MSSFRLPSDVLVSWKNDLSQHRGAADETLQEMLRALQTEGPDGHVVLTRHQVFSWAQAVEGAARKGKPQLQRVADDMRGYLRGDAAATSPALGAAPPVVAPPSPAPATSTSLPVASSAPQPRPGDAPPVLYQRAGAATGAPMPAGASRLVTERELGGFVQEMLREAKGEVILVSPWGLGLDTLANDLLQLPPNVVVKALTRRPPQEDEAYHRLMTQLRKRGFDIVFSNSIQTRLVVTDGARLLLGAASIPGPQSREAAVATTDAALVQAARENALRLIEDARAGR